MNFNPEVIEILKSYKINRDKGLLFLLGVYYELDVETLCSEEVIKSMALTKIVEKDYKTNTIQWNIPLFQGIESSFEWVKDWIEPFGKVNPERKGNYRDALARMKDFFKKYPEYRKDDVYKARDFYFKTLNNPKFCMHSHKFIFDGQGAMKKSTLLTFCERVTESSSSNNYQKGRVIS